MNVLSSLLSMLMATCVLHYSISSCAAGTFSPADKASKLEEISQLTEQIKLEPRRSMLYAKRGQCYVVLENWNKAIMDTNVALELKPNYSPYYVARANVYNFSGKHDLEKADLERAIQLDPQNEQALRGLAVVAALKKDYVQASALLSRALVVSPTSVDLHLLRAESLLNSKNFSAAQADCDYVRSIEPRNERLAVVLEEMKMVRGASK